MDFDRVLHSLMVAKRPAKSRRWWRRPTTFGGAAIFALSATAAGAVTSGNVAPAPQQAVSKTYTASAWPDLLQRHASTVAPMPATLPTATPAAAPAVVGAVNLCPASSAVPGAALTSATTSSPGTNGQSTAVLTGFMTDSTGSSGLNSLLPTISNDVSGAVGSLGLALPTLPGTTTTLPSSTPLSGGTGGAGTSGSSGSSSGSTTTTTTTTPTTTPPPTSPAPLNAASSPLPQSGLPNGADIGCDLIGTGNVGGMAPGETAAEASAVSTAVSLLGIPYQWGGESTQSGFDCSGMVQYVYRNVGIDLPRVAQNQYDAGPGVPPGATVEPGDLVFFGSGVNDVSHVGMYVGDGLMIDAPHTGAVVRFDRIAGFEPIVGVTAPGQG
jgi:cell wall-associated NlpC family hydrolase